MDASASSKVDAVKDVYAFFFKIENTNFETPSKQKSTSIKYTKLPEFEIENKGVWPKNSYVLPPRLRRIITLEEPMSQTSRSLKSMDPLRQPSITSNINRKIVTISEDEEYDLNPKFSSHSKKSSTLIINRAVETEAKKDPVKQTSQRNTSRLTTSSKYSKEARCAAKMNKVCDKKEPTSRSVHKSKPSHQASLDNIRSRAVVEKNTTRKTKSASLPRTSLSKNFVKPSESQQEMNLIKAKLNASLNSTPSKKSVEKTRRISSPPAPKGRALLLEMQKKSKLTPVIHVPLEDKCQKEKVIANTMPRQSEKPTIMVYTKPDGTMDTEIVLHRDTYTSTDPVPQTADQVTDMDGHDPEITYKYIQSTGLQADLIHETFDKLDIPNVSLKDNISFKETVIDLQSKSLPNLQIPQLNITDNRKENSFLDTRYCKSTSYIISRSTLTYKTQQKINFHVVNNNDNSLSNQLPSQLQYPMSVVSVIKKEMSSKDCGQDVAPGERHERKTSKKYKNRVNEIKSLNCSYVPNSNKLMKPSDIISTIRVNNGLLQSVLVCEQFQRELNFIDSFFESLQYLENCSLTEKSYKSNKIEQLVSDSAIIDPELDPKSSDYDKFFSKLENGASSDDSETMASKNLFLLNILIRDEQRRAKNLLYVLKRREDALKEFTKSQILYLENKKRQDNSDISALKKKQRGALLKLQHECGEMQRMRKALLALSEKRKLALMKTKKDLEFKIKNNVSVEHIVLGKKKLKRNTVVDRNSTPVRCFDLSSSGCEDNSSPSTSEGVVTEPVASAEKSIQTGDSIFGIDLIERATNTVDENFIAVDGGYLNILFQNLTLPQIFSGGKQYEVNAEALKNIVDSTNSRPSENWSDVVEKLMSQPKPEEDDKTSTPSTARSLVEEFEQYYRTLADEDRSPEPPESPGSAHGSVSPGKVYETNDAMVQISLCKMKALENKLSVETMTSAECMEVSAECDYEEAGPLPVPAGAPDPACAPPAPASLSPPATVCPSPVDTPTVTPHDTACPTPKSSDTSFTDSSASSQPPREASSPLPALDPTVEPVLETILDLTLEPAQESTLEPAIEPVDAEAEELRRQQLAIEREIKELEQQQSRLLVVREIPDKPPPPYTPPAEARPASKSRPFRADDSTHRRIRSYVLDPAATVDDPADAFDVLIHDFSEEALAKLKPEHSEKPWDAYHLLPQKPALDPDKLVAAASDELMEVLTAATPSSVSGVSSRRSDHIDDILFAEWRHAEPEWTSLHNDEALVKNQLFETIFQRILTETVDEYKRTVLAPPPENSLL